MRSYVKAFLKPLNIETATLDSNEQFVNETQCSHCQSKGRLLGEMPILDNLFHIRTLFLFENVSITPR